MKNSTIFSLLLLVLFPILLFAQNGARTGSIIGSSNYGTPYYPPTDNSIVYEDNMDGANDTIALKARGYLPYYRGTGPQGTTALWYQGNETVFPAYNGPVTGYVAANYNAVTGTNNIDSWLVFPALNLLAGDSLIFFERSPDGSTWPDSCRVMYSVSSTTPEGSWVELGRFKNSVTGWNRRAYGVPTSSAVGRLAIRYCVAGGGPSGNNSNYIGLDAISVQRAGSATITYAGQWAPLGTYPNIPIASYFTSSTWVGDTLYAHLPGAGVPSTTIVKYTLGGTWTTGVALPVAMIGGTLTKCGSKMYYIGGSSTAITTGGTGVYEYNPSTGVWTTKAPMPLALSAHCTVNWGDSVLFVIGGPYTGSATNLNVYYYRPGLDAWGTITNSLPAGMGRRTFGAGLSGNKIVISGGYNTAFLKSTVVGTIGADASQLTWVQGPNIPTAYTGLSRPGGTAYGDAFYLVCGEKGGPGGYMDSTFVFSISANNWVGVIPGKPVPTSNIFGSCTAKLINDTVKVFVVGAYNGAASAAFDVIDRSQFIIPVELLAFSAAARDNNIILNWSTATETNNLGFEIQRSANGSEFAKIAFIPGSGTSTEKRFYAYTDPNLNNGIYSYRLIQIDLDGSRNVLGTVSADVNYVPERFALFQNYPNPFNPSTTIKYQLPEKNLVTLRIFDILGNQVASLVNSEQEAGSYEVVFDASRLSSGVYMYTITAGKFSDTKKLLLMK